MPQKTAIDFQRQANAKDIHTWNISKCSICGASYGFWIYHGDVLFSSSCDCAWSQPSQSSWQEMADHYNLNIEHIEYIAKANELWGFDQVPTPED